MFLNSQNIETDPALECKTKKSDKLLVRRSQGGGHRGGGAVVCPFVIIFERVIDSTKEEVRMQRLPFKIMHQRTRSSYQRTPDPLPYM